jgi:hypothetical protein
MGGQINFIQNPTNTAKAIIWANRVRLIFIALPRAYASYRVRE